MLMGITDFVCVGSGEPFADKYQDIMGSIEHKAIIFDFHKAR